MEHQFKLWPVLYGGLVMEWFYEQYLYVLVSRSVDGTVFIITKSGLLNSKSAYSNEELI